MWPIQNQDHIDTPHPHKRETRKLRGIVPIQLLINRGISLNWAIDESSPTKFTFLYTMGFFTFLRKFTERFYLKSQVLT